MTPARLWLGADGLVDRDSLDGLEPDHVRELCRVATDLEELFATGQDVEWVVHAGAVHVVQSRDITAPGDRGATADRVGTEGATKLLTGVPASPGAAAGSVHLAFNIDQALRLGSGDVLVTPMTNPDMVVAMRRAAAIVTDVGGVICHAAIVSRELALPCVVGTASATVTLAPQQPVTVDGWTGSVYDGALDFVGPTAAKPLDWPDLWTLWKKATAGRGDLLPLAPTADALEAAPPYLRTVAVLGDLDLRCDERGQWRAVERLAAARSDAVFDELAARLARLADDRELHRLWVTAIDPRLGVPLSLAIDRLRHDRLAVHDEHSGPPLVLDVGTNWPCGPAVVPLGAAALVACPAPVAPEPLCGMGAVVSAGLASERFFGHRPVSRTGPMPDPATRAQWWALLPEYGRFHHEFATADATGDFEWLDIRPELVISTLLKSLVQPGFEMVPRVLNLTASEPLHLKWIRCRYHFRSDSFGRVWAGIVRGTWDEAFVVDLLERARASYKMLEEVLALFPATDEESRSLRGDQLVALVSSWWPRWVEFFALCWFIQAQGDDIVYPFIRETVEHNIARLGAPPQGCSWPSAQEFVAPLAPVLSGEYMRALSGLRQALLAAGFDAPEAAIDAIASGEHPELARLVDLHLREWGWMRDRDLLFQPWDTAEHVVTAALQTADHPEVPYERNRRRQLLALGFHVDLTHGSERRQPLAFTARLLHDLNVERENHHILWLRYSYPLRRVVIEMERRLIAAGSELDPGDVFFLQAPELLAAVARLPVALPQEVAACVRNRRRGYLVEAKLAEGDGLGVEPEDDYL